jgi:hypothetical protein
MSEDSVSARHHARIHFAAGFLACVAIPGLTVLDGSSWLAWTMYSKSATYRLTVSASDAGGNARLLAPTSLAAETSRELAAFLAGSERWRNAPVGPTLRRHLRDIAALGCRGEPRAARLRVVLEERPTLDAEVRTSSVEVECPRP